MSRQAQGIDEAPQGERVARQVLADLDILPDRQVRHQVVELEHESDLLSSKPGEVLGV